MIRHSASTGRSIGADRDLAPHRARRLTLGSVQRNAAAAAVFDPKAGPPAWAAAADALGAAAGTWYAWAGGGLLAFTVAAAALLAWAAAGALAVGGAACGLQDVTSLSQLVGAYRVPTAPTGRWSPGSAAR